MLVLDVLGNPLLVVGEPFKHVTAHLTCIFPEIVTTMVDPPKYGSKGTMLTGERHGLGFLFSDGLIHLIGTYSQYGGFHKWRYPNMGGF